MLFKKIIGLIVIYFLSIITLYAQDPSYFVLGETELKNAEIYSILQTDNEQLFVATNEGLYEYRYGKMHEVPRAQEQKGTSLFNLVSNSENEVFCFNLNGQIFKIENQKLVLFFEIPKQYLSAYISMQFDNTDRLILTSNVCMIINNNSFDIIYKSEKYRGLGLTKLPDGNVVLGIHNLDSIFSFKNNKILKRKTTQNIWPESHFYRHLLVSEKIIPTSVVDIITGDNKKNTVAEDLYEYSQFSSNKVWRRSKIGGIELLDVYDDKITLHNRFFSNKFISKIAEGKNGVLFLGTFGEGLYVIPNLNTRNYSSMISGESLQSLIIDDDKGLFVSDRIKGMLYFKDSVVSLKPSVTRVPDKLFKLSKSTTDIFVEHPSLFFGTLENIGAIKNISEVNTNTFLLASSMGVSKQGNSPILDDKLWESPRKNSEKTDYRFRPIQQRCNDVAFDKENSLLYAATISSLFQINSKGEKKEILFKGKPIIVNDLEFYNGELWCATQSNSILIFKEDNTIKHIGKKQGLESNYIYSFEEKNGKFYISHKYGFQIYDVVSKKWQTIGPSEGIDSCSIKDFSVGEENIWFLINNQVISVPISSIKNQTPSFSVKLDSVLVSNRNIYPKKISLYHDQNDLTFFTDFKGLPYEFESSFEYQLKGFDSIARIIPVTNAVISYEYLPPGNYDFSISAKYRNYDSETISYSFSIKKPYWQTWWFYLLIATFSISLLSVLLYFRNKKQQKKNRELVERQKLKTELIETELKALRSQMNPHFIFNSLNSIQDLILEKDTDASYDYIVLFSDLVRNALEYSNASYISLEEEIEFLDTYLQLEKLRFGSDFRFNIANGVNDTIKVPSLIIQPFVENAVVHGLFHKDGYKELQITFSIDENTLQCVIKDNGIGRDESKKIQDRQGDMHDSYALDAVAKRLKILENKHNQKAGFTIEDLIKNDIALGTLVRIQLPFLE